MSTKPMESEHAYCLKLARLVFYIAQRLQMYCTTRCIETRGQSFRLDDEGCIRQVLRLMPQLLSPEPLCRESFFQEVLDVFANTKHSIPVKQSHGCAAELSDTEAMANRIAQSLMPCGDACLSEMFQKMKVECTVSPETKRMSFYVRIPSSNSTPLHPHQQPGPQGRSNEPAEAPSAQPVIVQVKTRDNRTAEIRIPRGDRRGGWFRFEEEVEEMIQGQSNASRYSFVSMSERCPLADRDTQKELCRAAFVERVCNLNPAMVPVTVDHAKVEPQLSNLGVVHIRTSIPSTICPRRDAWILWVSPRARHRSVASRGVPQRTQWSISTRPVPQACSLHQKDPIFYMPSCNVDPRRPGSTRIAFTLPPERHTLHVLIGRASLVNRPGTDAAVASEPETADWISCTKENVDALIHDAQTQTYTIPVHKIDSKSQLAVSIAVAASQHFQSHPAQTVTLHPDKHIKYIQVCVFEGDLSVWFPRTMSTRYQAPLLQYHKKSKCNQFSLDPIITRVADSLFWGPFYASIVSNSVQIAIQETHGIPENVANIVSEQYGRVRMKSWLTQLANGKGLSKRNVPTLKNVKIHMETLLNQGHFNMLVFNAFVANLHDGRQRVFHRMYRQLSGIAFVKGVPVQEIKECPDALDTELMDFDDLNCPPQSNVASVADPVEFRKTPPRDALQPEALRSRKRSKRRSPVPHGRKKKSKRTGEQEKRYASILDLLRDTSGATSLATTATTTATTPLQTRKVQKRGVFQPHRKADAVKPRTDNSPPKWAAFERRYRSILSKMNM